MLQAKIIRNDIFNKMNGAIDGVQTYHNGRPLVLDDTQLPVLAVYLDDLQTGDDNLGGSYWNAKLNITAYVPGNIGDSGLDDLSEQIISYMDNIETDSHLEELQLDNLTYQHDENGFVWRAVNIKYAAMFYRGNCEEDDE